MSSTSRPRLIRRSTGVGRFLTNPFSVIGLLIVLGLVFMAVFAPLIAPTDPNKQDLRSRRAPPSLERPLGADEFGRDMLSRLIFGARASLTVAFLSVGIGLVLGTSLGLLAAYMGGLVDTFIMRAMDLLLAFPYLLLAILIVSVLGPSLWNTSLAIALWTVPAFSRVARSSALQVKEREFVSAAKALGARSHRVVGAHLLPNINATLIVYASLYLAYAILMEAGLSFLGLGVQPPQASWAGMIASGRNYVTSAPHIVTVPGIAIALTVLGFNLLGDGLRDALDPRTNR